MVPGEHPGWDSGPMTRTASRCIIPGGWNATERGQALSTRTDGASPDTRVLGRRVAAAVVDQSLLGVLLAPAIVPEALASFLAGSRIGALVDALAGSGASQTIHDFLSDVGLPVTLVVGFAYFAVMEGRYGRTLGKMALGIRVVRRDGGTIGAWAAVLRTLMRGVDGFGLYLVAFVMALLSKKNRRLGDMAARTLVVRS